jgi:hypothetical protein
MGAWCVVHKSHQPFRRTLTVDQLPARKAQDVLGYELGCGCKYGKKEFMEIQEKVNAVKIKFAEKLQDLEKDQSTELAKLLSVMEGGKVSK